MAWRRAKVVWVLVWVAAALAGADPADAARRPLRIIVMIADGCGFGQRAAESLYRYHRLNGAVYDGFPVQLAMSTHSAEGNPYDPLRAWADTQWVLSGCTDSAAAATAMSTGVKTLNHCLGLDAREHPVPHVIERAEERGMATGVVSTVPWSHATPAGFVVHNADRNDYAGIAQAMVNRSKVDVIMGAGHPWFDNNGAGRAKPSFTYVGGESTWARLVAGTAGGDADGDAKPDPFTLITGRAAFAKLANGTPPRRVLGTAEVDSALQVGRKGTSAEPYADPPNPGVPDLALMCRGALNVLGRDRDGFYLMAEGGAVDWACHSNLAGRAIEEQAEFEDAVRAVVRWVEQNGGWRQTLLIVTGDHETGSLTGPDAAGPWAELQDGGEHKLPLLAWHSKGHSNALIPLSAKGLGADLLQAAADRTDPRRGRYLDNTSVAKVAFELMR